MSQPRNPYAHYTDETYPCEQCGELRTKAEGATVFILCDECWDRSHPAKGEEAVTEQIKPATDEEIAETTWNCDCSTKGPNHPRSCMMVFGQAIEARIEADRAQIKRCHAIIQGLVASVGPENCVVADAEKELSGEFCPGSCTTACDTGREADGEKIAQLEALNAEMLEALKGVTTCRMGWYGDVAAIIANA